MKTNQTIAVALSSVLVLAGGVTLTLMDEPRKNPDPVATTLSPTPTEPDPAPATPTTRAPVSATPTTSATLPRPAPKPSQPSLVSTHTATFPVAEYRTRNIGRAAELINGSLVKPGETWSLNQTVGERTEENGFVEGNIIGANGVYEKSLGGGVSTVATALFNATLLGGLDVVERGAHSFYIERYLEGRDATVAWGTLDYKFHNDSGHPLTIRASATDHSVTITFRGTPKYDKVTLVTGPRMAVTEPGIVLGDPEKCVEQTPYAGFDVTITREMLRGGILVGQDDFSTSYKPRDEVICPETTENPA